MAQRKTISDVAAKAGVSRSLVSAVLSGKKSTIRVSAATRENVLQAAREINYSPSLIAKSLLAKKSFLLAYLCSGGGSWGVSTRLLQSIQNACRQHDYSLVVYPSDSLEDEARNLRAALERQVDGIIVSPLMNIEQTNEELFRKTAEQGTPVIQIGQTFSGIPCVTRDFYQIGEEAAQLLVQTGKRNILMLTYDNYQNPKTGPASNAEYNGYCSVMKKNNLETEIFAVSLSRLSGGSNLNYKASVTETAYRQIKSYLDSKKTLPDAILASSNSLGYGIAYYCRENGLKIPEDMVILSCSDDLMIPSVMLPELSCFPLAAEEIGKAAVEQCLSPSGLDMIKIRQVYKQETSFVMRL